MIMIFLIAENMSHSIEEAIVIDETPRNKVDIDKSLVIFF